MHSVIGNIHLDIMGETIKGLIYFKAGDPKKIFPMELFDLLHVLQRPDSSFQFLDCHGFLRPLLRSGPKSGVLSFMSYGRGRQSMLLGTISDGFLVIISIFQPCLG